MSSAFPTLTCAYSSNGSSWSGDLGPVGAGDCSEIKMNLRELVNGTGLTEIILNNYKGKYMATIFPPWPQETGLGYFWKWTINGIGPWYGRAIDLSPDLSVKAETLHVSVAMMDDPLKNHYLIGLIPQDTIANMVRTGCQEWGPPSTGFGTGNTFTMGGVTYTIDASKSGPGPQYPVPTGYNCARTRIYAIDFIKDLLVTANDASNLYYGWSGYVDSTQGPAATTLYVFKQGANTYSSSIIYGTNVSTIRNSRNILRSKNFIEYVAALSNSEPAQPFDPWTENDLSFWKALQGTVASTTTHYCPVLGQEVYLPCVQPFVNAAGQGIGGGITLDTYSIVGTGNPTVSLDLNLQAALGETFNSLFRNATSLNFYYKAPMPGGFGGLGISDGNVQLKDANGTVIQSSNGLNVTGTSGRTGSTVAWASWSAPVGAMTQYVTGLIRSPGTNVNITTLYWGVIANGSVPGGFDWANITDIIFNLNPVPSQGQISLSLDHLYWAQSYQPTTSMTDPDALAVYGQRMQYADASMYYTDAGLKAFAQANVTRMSPPSMQIDVTTSLGPEAEASGKGFQPGYCFPAGNVQVSNYGYNAVAWRAVEVETHIRVGNDGGCTTRFILTPASTTGIGTDMARWEPRKSW